MTNKATIQDLEQQIDYLVGYTNQGTHWKQEFHLREALIEAVLLDELVPEETKNKIYKLQDMIYRLRTKEASPQTYLEAHKDENIERRIVVHGIDGDTEIILTGRKEFPSYIDWYSK